MMIAKTMFGILLSVVVLFSQPREASSLVCYECLEGEYSLLCNITATLTQCQDQEAVCFTQIGASLDDLTLLTSHKTCMTRQLCEQEEAKNPVSCHSGVISQACTWCCTQDRCNYDRMTYVRDSSVTPTPDIPHTTDPAPDCLPVATTNCTHLDLQHCIDQYAKDIDVFLDDDNFQSLCTNIPAVISCLTGALESCYQPNSLEGVANLLSNAVTSLRGTCPNGCDEKSAVECTYHLIERVIHIIMSPGGSCELLTREIEAHLQCVSLTVQSCGSSLYTKYTHLSAVLRTTVTNVCYVLPATIHPPNTTLPAPTVWASSTPRITTSGVTNPTPSSTNATPTQRPRTTSTAPQPTSRTVLTTSTAPIGGAVTPTPTLPPPTEHPTCMASAATQCITQLAHELVQLMSLDNPDYSDICANKLQATITCARTNTEQCSPFVKNRIEIAIEYLRELLGDACALTTTPTRVCDTEAARGCVIQLLTYAADSDPRRACLFRENATTCVAKLTVDCTEAERTSIQGVLQTVLNDLNPRCDVIVQCVDENILIVLREGDGSHTVQFSFTHPPSHLCAGVPGCKIFVDFLPDEINRSPRCRNGQAAKQIVVGDIDQDTTGNAAPSCSREITDDNWDGEHTVSLTAKIDLARDGDQSRDFNIVLRKVVDGYQVQRWVVCSYQILIIDVDSNAVCKSTNDPHIHTFDKRFYNNHYQGIFRLYQHTDYPYEVQVAFAQCFPNSSPTCNCAVYVRAGSTVFVVDKCNTRKSNRRCRGNSCARELRTALYVDGFITPGMRIYSSANGRIFDVVLPHGTRVKINDAETTLINVYIYPSPHDWGKTRGLCGLYDGDRTTDLMDATGRFFDYNIDRLPNKMPRSLCASWRVPRDEYLVGGYHGDAFVAPSLCQCDLPIDQKDAAAVDTCGPEALVETCHLRLGGDIIRRLRHIPPVELPRSVRGKRMAADDVYEELIPDFDEEYDPTVVPFEPTWTEADARHYCWEYLRGDPLIGSCLTVPGINLDLEMEICIEDILYTGNTTWAPRAREVALETCSHELRTNMVYTDTTVGARLSDIVLGKMCPSDCSGHGECINEECQCSESHFGADCSLESGMTPNVFGLLGGNLCQSDVTDCSTIVVIGETFTETPHLSCYFEQIHFLESDEDDDLQMTVNATLLSYQQIACDPPRPNQSYKVKVTADGFTFSRELLYIPFNGNCYSCVHEVENNITCNRRMDSCIDGSTCYRTGEHSPHSECLVCDPTSSSSSLSRGSGVGCLSTTFIIIAAVCAVFVVICVLVLGVCLCRRCRSKQTSGLVADGEGGSHSRLSSIKFTKSSEV